MPGLSEVEAAAFFGDGRLALLGREDPTGPNGLFVFTEGGRPRPISPPTLPTHFFAIFVSPDERFVAALGAEELITLYSVTGAEPVPVPECGVGRVPAGWLSDGSLLVADVSKVPVRLERFDPRTRKTSFSAAVSPSDPAVIRMLNVRVTPDGQTIAFNVRRVSGALYVLDWGGHLP